ncbi:hypothetical protein Trydic_g9907 [Trypoxylus dichotomus]
MMATLLILQFRWISRIGPTRSPDVTPPAFFKTISQFNPPQFRCNFQDEQRRLEHMRTAFAPSIQQALSMVPYTYGFISQTTYPLTQFMIMAFKAQKALEFQVHDALYKNIEILTFFHPPHKDFYDVFKKDMFVKNNKTAFVHIVYFLLRVLNPNLIKSKIASWPVLDIQDERQFRSEVVKYLNELNDLYENANLPNVMPSQLVSPGGFRFARLKFYKNLSNLGEDADNIIKQLNEVQCAISSLKTKMHALEVNSVESGEVSSGYKDRIELLKVNLSKITLRCEKLTKIKEKLADISESNLTLQNTTSNEELNLISLFEKFNLEMENHCLEMESFTEPELTHYIEKFTKCNDELAWLKDNMDTVHKKWLKLSTDVQNSSNGSKKKKAILQDRDLFPLPLSTGDSTILAVPLEASESI